jgi:hypothetical protein
MAGERGRLAVWPAPLGVVAALAYEPAPMVEQVTLKIAALHAA